jgi:hypothetical protein
VTYDLTTHDPTAGVHHPGVIPSSDALEDPAIAARLLDDTRDSILGEEDA